MWLKNLKHFYNPRPLLQRGLGWFFTLNILFYGLIALNYFSVVPLPSTMPGISVSESILSWGFLICSWLAQLALLSFIASLPALLCGWFRFKPTVVIGIAIISASLLALFLIVDSMAYKLFHFHTIGIVWELLRTGVLQEVVVLSYHEIFYFILILIGISLVEIFLAHWAWKKISVSVPRGYGQQVVLILSVSLFLSYLLMLRSSGIGTDERTDFPGTQQIVLESQAIPFYTPILGLLVDRGLDRLESAGTAMFKQIGKVNLPLHYPEHVLHYSPSSHPYNILWIVLDDWRYDMMNPTVTPHISAFSKKTFRFTDYFSGGNATGPGIFTLFYSVPYTYWTAMLKQHQGPVLIQALLKDNYQMGIFRSASLRFPAFHKTIFRDVKPLTLDMPGNQAFIRDQEITKRFTHFLKIRDKHRPFFGFVFYDATHSYCDDTVTYPTPFQPAIAECDRMHLSIYTPVELYKNRYKNAIHFVDGLVGSVINELDQQHLLNNTLVIITGDHGEEFNDGHQRYWGHASAYDEWQLHVPFLLYWPGKMPGVQKQAVTSYDVVPFLMGNLLGCQNPASDYSVGHSLFDLKPRALFLAASYADFAIVQPTQVTRIYPEGNFVVKGPAGEDRKGFQLDKDALKSAVGQMKQFFKP